MTEQQSEVVENAFSSAAGLGASLRGAREAKGISQQDVSNSLRFSVKQIEALENDAFELFPDAMMTRGFIRSYAKYLDIDAEPLLAIYRATLGEDAQKVIAIKSSMRPVALTNESWPWLKYILATIVVLLFLLAWMLYVEFMPKQSESDVDGVAQNGQPAVEAKSETGESTISLPSPPMPEAALPAAERVTEANADEAIQDITDQQLPESVALPARTSEVKVTASISASSAASASPAVAASPAVSATGKSLSFVFTGQSWVSVKDKTGKLVYEKLGEDGMQETITATPPLTVVIGNASSTTLQFSGQAVDLTSNIKNNVARITLE